MSADSKQPRPPVVVVTGPTASGKTELAIEIAERFAGEVVNADSMQIYRDLNIGTAKPSLAQRARVPHHMLDVVAPDVEYNAGLYQRDAREIAHDIFARQKITVLTGGTGLYIRAFLEGLLDTGAANPDLRKALEAEHARAVAAGDSDRLHRRLQISDRAAAEKIHPNDSRRVIRALELGEQGELASKRRSLHGFQDRPFRAIHLAIDPGREVLNARIDERCRQMIEGGASARGARAARTRLYSRSPTPAIDRVPPHGGGRRRPRHADARTRTDAARYTAIRASSTNLATQGSRCQLAQTGRHRIDFRADPGLLAEYTTRQEDQRRTV